MKINGKKIAENIINNIKNDYSLLKNKFNKPKWGIILVGNRPDSNIFIKKKIELCNYLEFDSDVCILNKNCKEDILINSLKNYNEDNKINGIVLQLPLPKQFRNNWPYILSKINKNKDVDCLNPYNYSNMFIDKEYVKTNWMFPCISLAVNEIIKEINVSIKGKKTVIIGRSYLVGFPLKILFQQKGCIITLCNETTFNINEIIKDADIIVSATGAKHLIKIKNVKKDAILIDIGVTMKNGKYYGDIEKIKKEHDFRGYYTPVPGGVGPITVSIWMKNLFNNWLNKNKINSNKF